MYLKVWSLPEPESILKESAEWAFINSRPVYSLSEVMGDARAVQLLMSLAEKYAAEIRRFSPSAAYIGSSRGEIALLVQGIRSWEGTGKVSPTLSPETSMGTLASQVARYLGITGSAATISQTCLSGLSALHMAALHVRAGEGRCVLFGAVDAPLTPFFVETMAALRIYTRETTPPYVRPGHVTSKNTFALGEGAVLGLLSSERFSPFKLVQIRLHTAPVRHGVSFTAVDTEALTALLSQMEGEKPDFVLLHAPGTAQGDAAEWEAVYRVWGDIPVLSIKRFIGHTLGAAPLLSLSAALFLLQTRKWVSMPYATFWKGSLSPVRWREVIVIGLGYGGVMGALRIQYEP
ncbi:MAG: hypothetical protein NZZ60_05915 [Bacteroidia bacterium]|nr:hypothetical protein [Bacteroidia bacterium]MCX7652237.1 hypothetical protein [Bacteroidia bacterium]MDW8416499.1 beta-ketoacyl synthase N-terminal-like domain-containing protein [Bacteroidia bacterium]